MIKNRKRHLKSSKKISVYKDIDHGHGDQITSGQFFLVYLPWVYPELGIDIIPILQMGN